MNHDHYPDNYINDILRHTKTIALIGASANPARPSHGVMRFLLSRGYHVIPVNPGLAGGNLLGQRVYASLRDLPTPVDMIDIFRKSSALPDLVAEVLQLPVLPKYIWMQLGVVDIEAATLAESRGIQVVMNRCPAIEIPRLGIL